MLCVWELFIFISQSQGWIYTSYILMPRLAYDNRTNGRCSVYYNPNLGFVAYV